MKPEENTPDAVDTGEVGAKLDEAIDHASAAEATCRRIETATKAGFEDLSIRFTRATTSLSDRIRELEKALGDRQRESIAQLAAAYRRSGRGARVIRFFTLLAALIAAGAAVFAAWLLL